MCARAPYADLQDEATKLLGVVRRQARRGFVLEITGTPKAGKTTSISMIESFFKTCGWRVHVLTERAAVCPLKMKGHFFFNTWTTSTMIAEFLDLIDREIDLVIVDRGFFDALIWLELQHRRGQVDHTELRIFQQFVLLQRWQLTDAVALLQVSPDTAIIREHDNRLLPRIGSVMKVPALEEFNDCIKAARAVWATVGGASIIDVTCEGPSQKDIVAGLIREVIPRIRQWADPAIAAISRAKATDVFGVQKVLPWSEPTWARIVEASTFSRRSSLEKNEDMVQLVACGATTGPMAEASDQQGVFVFDRKGKKIPYGRHTVFHRCHVHGEGPLTLDHVADALQGRLRELLYLREIPPPYPLGLVWDPQSKIETAHLGICFRVPLDGQVADTLMEKEFKTNGRGHPMTSTFAFPKDLLARADLELEPWSRDALAARWL